MPDTEALIERLREYATTRYRDGEKTDVLLHEAADALAARSRELEEMVTTERETASDLVDALARAEAAEAALAFYSDERNYRRQPVPDAERGHYPEHTLVLTDGGKRARAALAGEGT